MVPPRGRRFQLPTTPFDRAAGWATRRLLQRANHRTLRSRKNTDRAIRRSVMFCEEVASASRNLRNTEA